MKALIIEATDNSPRVVFDPARNVFEMSGESRPENVDKFYSPLIHWMESYSQEAAHQTTGSKKATLDLKLEYFNTSSSKFILNLLAIIRDIQSKNKGVFEVRWFYDKYDLDMKEAGEEFIRLLNLQMSLVPSMN